MRLLSLLLVAMAITPHACAETLLSVTPLACEVRAYLDGRPVALGAEPTALDRLHDGRQP